ncbi:MAG: hypothetical protein ACKVQJ_05505 [Pyrinomonadaceae bacterium]
MWSKLYLVLLAFAVILLAFLTFYSWSWLQSIGSPTAAVAGYEYYSGIGWPALWVSMVVLLAMGNGVLWESGRSWAMWTTFIYFSVGLILRFFWLDQSFFQFKKNNSLVDASVSFAPLMAVILIILMAVIVFFDTFLVVRLRAKTYPEPVDEEPKPTAE